MCVYVSNHIWGLWSGPDGLSCMSLLTFRMRVLRKEQLCDKMVSVPRERLWVHTIHFAFATWPHFEEFRSALFLWSRWLAGRLPVPMLLKAYGICMSLITFFYSPCCPTLWSDLCFCGIWVFSLYSGYCFQVLKNMSVPCGPDFTNKYEHLWNVK